ncbi:MAG: hypothetical protein KH088_17085, partial [Bacteroides sp.]|nr:hypothetical protein [Bacteroides sp.]
WLLWSGRGLFKEVRICGCSIILNLIPFLTIRMPLVLSYVKQITNLRNGNSVRPFRRDSHVLYWSLHNG